MGSLDQGREGNDIAASKEEYVYIAKPNVFNKKHSVPVPTYNIQWIIFVPKLMENN